MTEISRYADGQKNSTNLIEDEMVRAGQIDTGERNAMHWHAGSESPTAMLTRMKGEERDHSLAEDAKQHLALEAYTFLPHLAGKTATEAAAEVLPHLAEGLSSIGTIAIMQGAEATHMYGSAIMDSADLHARNNEAGVEVTALCLLDVDASFQSAALKRLDGIQPSRTLFALKEPSGKLTEEGKTVVPFLQAAADSGARAALTAMQTQGRAEFLHTHREIARRLAVDVAFNIGFENAMSLHDQPAALLALEARIDARNPWTIANLPVRG